MSKYTEGEWGYEEGQTIGGNYFAQIVKIDGNTTKELGQLADFEVSQSETKANAQLIAAAPELMEAAKEALKYFKDKISKMDDINEDEEAPEWVIIPMKLENAIKKAEGDNDRY